MDTDVPSGAVLVGLDDSTESARALDWAAAEARRGGWPLHLMHVLHDHARTDSDPATTRPPTRPVILDAILGLGSRQPGLAITWSQPIGDAAVLLANGARAARVTVVGSRGRSSIRDAVLGSVTIQLIARTRCPVAVLRADTRVPRPDAPVVVGIAYDAGSSVVLDAALEQASSRQVDLIAVHAWQLDSSTIVDGLQLQGLPADEAQRREAALLQRTITSSARVYPEVVVRTDAVRDGTAQALGRYARDAALLVVGSRGRGEIGGAILGSVSQSVIRYATCPVLVVPDGRALASTGDEKAAEVLP